MDFSIFIIIIPEFFSSWLIAQIFKLFHSHILNMIIAPQKTISKVTSVICFIERIFHGSSASKTTLILQIFGFFFFFVFDHFRRSLKSKLSSKTLMGREEGGRRGRRGGGKIYTYIAIS